MDGQINLINKVRSYWWITPLLLVSILCLFRSAFFSLHDFTNYYFGAKIWLAGEFTKDSFLPCQFNEQIRATGYHGYFGNYNPNPPFLLLLMAPFSFLEAQIAKLVFNVLSILLFSYSIFQLVKNLKVSKSLIFLFPLIFLIPLKNSILFGQPYLLIASLLIFAILFYERGEKFKASLFLAITISIKIFPILFLLHFFIKRDWRVLAYSLTLVIVGVCLMSVLTGLELSLYYLSEVLPTSFRGLLSEEFVLNYQSINTWSYSLFTTNSEYNPNPLFENLPIIASFFTALLSAAVISALASFIQSNSSKNSFGLIMLCSVILTPYGATYSLLISGAGFILLYDHLNKKTQWICLALFVLSWIKPIQFEHFVLLPRLWSLLVILLVTVVEANVKFTWPSLLLAILVFSLKLDYSEKINIDYAVSPKSLICEFEIEGDLVHLKGINHSGVQEWSENLKHGKGNLELSSKGRGLGFNTLIYSKSE